MTKDDNIFKIEDDIIAKDSNLVYNKSFNTPVRNIVLDFDKET